MSSKATSVKMRYLTISRTSSLWQLNVTQDLPRTKLQTDLCIVLLIFCWAKGCKKEGLLRLICTVLTSTCMNLKRIKGSLPQWNQHQMVCCVNIRSSIHFQICCHSVTCWSHWLLGQFQYWRPTPESDGPIQRYKESPKREHTAFWGGHLKQTCNTIIWSSDYTLSSYPQVLPALKSIAAVLISAFANMVFWAYPSSCRYLLILSRWASLAWGSAARITFTGTMPRV